MIQKILSEIEGRLQEREFRAASVVAKSIFIRFTANGAQRAAFSLNHGHLRFPRDVNDSDTCYRVLGQMHSLYKPVRVA